MMYKSPRTTGFPKKLLMKMKYSGNILLNPGGSQKHATWDFAGNDVRDPNVTGIGTSALDFQKLMAVYTKFRVHGCKLKVAGYTLVAASGGQSIVVLRATETLANPPTTIKQALREGDIRWAIPPNATGGDKYKLFKMYRKTKNMLHVRDISDDPNISGSVNLSPVTRWFYQIFVGTINETTTLTGVHLLVEFVYYVEFYDRIPADYDALTGEVGATGPAGSGEIQDIY